ncbi:MAG: hypothetical protein NTW93_04120 [Phycisphaerae bacterium]|nr:hypothetical protein [Phycisphaerae bacterium]
MKNQSLFPALFDFLKAVVEFLFTLLKTVSILLFIWLRNFLMIRLGLLSFLMRFSKINRVMKRCRTKIHKTLKAVEELDNALVAHIREAFEKTKTGQRTVKTDPNRRLYAVLIPTKEENIQRIKNVFDSMNYEEKLLKLNELNYLLKDNALKTLKQSVSFLK